MRFSAKIRLLAVGLVIATAVAIGIVTGWGFHVLASGRLNEAATRTLELEARRLDSAFLELAHDVRFLAGLSTALEACTPLGGPPDAVREELVELFVALGRAKRHYLQVRLIDRSGQELVRVDLSPAGRPVAREDDELQSKEGRAYVLETLARPDRTYVSPIDLNREHGVVEEPHRPVLRAARAVCGAAGECVGLVVVNLDFRPFIEGLLGTGQSSTRHYLANAAGDWLLHPQPTRTFGFDLGRRWLAQEDEPALAPLFRSTSGRSDAILTSPDSSLGRTAFRRVYAFPSEPGRFVVLGVGGSFDDGGAGTIVLRALLLTAALGAIGLVVALGTARSLTRPLLALTDVARRLTAGERDVELPRAEDDDIGAFVGAFERMVAALQEEEQQLAAILDSTSEGILSTDEAGHVTTFNQSCAGILGITRDEALGRRLADLLPPALVSERAEDHAADGSVPPRSWVRAEGEPPFELSGLRRDGGVLHVLATARKVLRAGCSTYTVTLTDLTELRQAEDDLRATNRSLVEANRELDAFVYSASHDLRAPLRSMLGLIALGADAIDEGDLEAARTTFLPLMRQSVERLDRLVVDLLAISRVDREEIERAPVDLVELVGDCFGRLAHAEEAHGVELVHAIDVTEPVPIDGTRVEQVLSNLISNAIAYRKPAPAQASVRVEIRRPEAGWLRIEVVDEGVGIAPAYRPRLFTMFARGGSGGSGAGLGLYLVHKQVERLNGRISYSTGDWGTAFIVELPIPDHPS